MHLMPRFRIWKVHTLMVAISVAILTVSSCSPTKDASVGPTTAREQAVPSADIPPATIAPADSSSTEDVSATVTGSGDVGGEVDTDSAGRGGRDFDNPTADWAQASHLSSVDQAAAFVKFKPVTGKFVSNGEPATVTVGNGDLLLHYPKARSYIYESSGGFFSNAIAVQFVKDHSGSAKKGGTAIELVDLGGGFQAILMVGSGSSTIQFGSDDMIIPVVSPPDSNGVGRGRVLSMARAVARELAEITKPGTAMADPPIVADTVPAAPVATLTPTTADQHLASGIYRSLNDLLIKCPAVAGGVERRSLDQPMRAVERHQRLSARMGHAPL